MRRLRAMHDIPMKARFLIISVLLVFAPISTIGVYYYNSMTNVFMPNFSVHDTVWWFLPLVDEANVTDWWQARIRKSAEVERGYSSVFDLQNADEKLVIISSPFTMLPPNEEFAKLGNKLGTYMADELVKLIAGSRPLTDFDAILEKWKGDGGTQYVELANQLLKK